MIQKVFDIFMSKPDEIITAVIIMVSAVIVLMGILKRVLFNRIKRKSIRCVALSFSSLALMYLTTAVYFLINTVDFQYFLPCGTAICFVMIITYWFYENTQARAGIHRIGSFVLSKITKAIVSKVNTVAEGTEVIGSAIDGLLKGTEAKSERKDDLKGL